MKKSKKICEEMILTGKICPCSKDINEHINSKAGKITRSMKHRPAILAMLSIQQVDAFPTITK